MVYVAVPLHNSMVGQKEKTETLVILWRMIEQEGKVQSLFHDGTVRSLLDWLQVMNNDNVFPLVVMGREDNQQQPYQYRPCAVAWLNQYSHHTARAHFVVLGKYHRKIGETIIDYWYSLRNADNTRLLNVVVGVTPETNTAMLKLIRILGFTAIGTIPKACWMAYDGKAVGGVVSHYEMVKGG
jgi:hypothetical protein